MIFSRAPRSPALAPFVEAVWVHRDKLPHRFERVLPSGRMQLLVNLEDDELCDYTLDGRWAHRTRGAALQGPRNAPMVIDTAHQNHICGVSFAVGGASAFLGVPACDLRGDVVELSDVWGPEGDLVRERLLDAPDGNARLDVLETILLEHGPNLEHAHRAARLVTSAWGLLQSGARVRSVGDGLGLSPRRLIDLFQEHIGIGPKQMARLARFQAVLGAAGAAAEARVSWVELAVQHGFSDQAHLIREFRSFAGTTPRAHRPRSREALQHALLDAGQFSSIPGLDV